MSERSLVTFVTVSYVQRSFRMSLVILKSNGTLLESAGHHVNEQPCIFLSSFFKAWLTLYFSLDTKSWVRGRCCGAVCFCSPGWQRASWVAWRGWPCSCPSAAQRAECPVPASAEGRRALLELRTAYSPSPSQSAHQGETDREGRQCYLRQKLSAFLVEWNKLKVDYNGKIVIIWRWLNHKRVWEGQRMKPVTRSTDGWRCVFNGRLSRRGA